MGEYGYGYLPSYWGGSSYGRVSQPAGSAFSLDALRSYGVPAGVPDPTIMPLVPSKAALDGTDAFGLNSVPGAYSLATMPGPAAAAESGSWMDTFNKWVGTKEAPGPLGFGVGAASALGNGILALKQYGLAKEALAENKRQFELNYNAQKSTTNTALEDRQRARYASNPGAYQSPSDYMNQHRVV